MAAGGTTSLGRTDFDHLVLAAEGGSGRRQNGLEQLVDRGVLHMKERGYSRNVAG